MTLFFILISFFCVAKRSLFSRWPSQCQTLCQGVAFEKWDKGRMKGRVEPKKAEEHVAVIPRQVG